jgi:adenylate cyclase
VTRADTVAELRVLVGRGEYLTAYDRAVTALEAIPDDLEVHYLAVLALVRSGATTTALAQIDERFGALGPETPDASPQLLEDIAALRARIAKEHALADLTPERAAVAAAAYEEVFDRFHGSYPCINAATLWLLAGEVDRARRLAAEALAITRGETPGSTVDAYWAAATEAESLLVLGEPDGARAALVRAEQEAPGDHAARARLLLDRMCVHLSGEARDAFWRRSPAARLYTEAQRARL